MSSASTKVPSTESILSTINVWQWHSPLYLNFSGLSFLNLFYGWFCFRFEDSRGQEWFELNSTRCYKHFIISGKVSNVLSYFAVWVCQINHSGKSFHYKYYKPCIVEWFQDRQSYNFPSYDLYNFSS